ncbi:hypothetical protein C3L56_01160 [Veillonellaceae bacterium M2-4]|nr:hypothetical protein [Veillonellaceae bacterium M2-4]
MDTIRHYIREMQQGDMRNVGTLIEMFQPFMWKLIKQHRDILEQDEIQSICTIAVFEGAKEYDLAGDVKAVYYFFRKMSNAVRREIRRTILMRMQLRQGVQTEVQYFVCPVDDIAYAQLVYFIEEVIKDKTPMEKDIIRDYLHRSYTFRALGKKYNITAKKASRIVHRLLEELRREWKK